MPKRTLFYGLFAIAMITLFSSIASAQCSCERTDRQASLNASDVVFWGKGKVNDEGEFVFRVSKSLKGTRRKRKHTVVPKGDCSASFEEDTYYIVFADKDEKRAIHVSSCRATTALPKSPFTATTWSAADELPYGVGRRTARRHQLVRRRVTDRALDKTRYAARKCDDGWTADDEATLEIEVRFDVRPDGTYVATVTEYTSPSKPVELQSCLSDKLDGKKFRKFRGNAVSVKSRWYIDRVDATLKQESKSATVIPYEGKPGPDTDEDDS